MAVTRVTVYEDRIQAAFEEGGSITDNIRRIGKLNFAAAQHYVPRRTGFLAKSLYLRIMPTTALRKGYVVGTTVDYAIFSLAGTTGPILPKKGPVLWMRPSPFSRLAFSRIPDAAGRWPFESVAGQAQNDWLGRSLFVTMKSQGL
jgi:hypothetical protein